MRPVAGPRTRSGRGLSGAIPGNTWSSRKPSTRDRIRRTSSGATPSSIDSHTAESGLRGCTTLTRLRPNKVTPTMCSTRPRALSTRASMTRRVCSSDVRDRGTPRTAPFHRKNRSLGQRQGRASAPSRATTTGATPSTRESHPDTKPSPRLLTRGLKMRSGPRAGSTSVRPASSSRTTSAIETRTAGPSRGSVRLPLTSRSSLIPRPRSDSRLRKITTRTWGEHLPMCVLSNQRSSSSGSARGKSRTGTT